MHKKGSNYSIWRKCGIIQNKSSNYKNYYIFEKDLLVSEREE